MARGVKMPDDAIQEVAESESIIYELKDDIAWITLNRPERRNAVDAAMCRELAQNVAQATEAGVVVLQGAGGSFCAGGNLGNLATPTEAGMRELYAGMFTALQAIRLCPRPVIASVDGAAVGGGNEIVIACDIAIATERAVLGQTGPRVGSAPVFGGTNLLAISIGEKRAKEVSFMCRKYSSIVALEMGWINAVVGNDSLVAETTAWANELLELSPRYLEIAKSTSNAWWNACSESYNGGVSALIQAIGSEDMMEGASAFLEHRRPDFRALRKK
jgi:2-ketocyclohexanecarboxyl-CoA hydrolase